MSTRPRRHLSPRPSSTARLAHREQAPPSSPEIRFRVDFDDRCSIGVGKIRLLEVVEQTGSLSRAARAIAMSYRRAWLLIDSMNAEFDTPVISASVGGSGGGGAKLTPFGRELIQAYRKLETRLAPLTADCMSTIAMHAIGRRHRAAARSASRKSIARSLKREIPR
jgi:molybdate transport system regulatory protein